MKTQTTVRLLQNTVGNPAARALLRHLAVYCEKDGKNRLEVAVELYTGQRDTACLACRMAEKVIAGVLRRGAMAFDVEEQQLRETFSDGYWAKGLASTIRGIAEFGVHRPFTPGAPFQVVWDVTTACNLNCRHCYATAGARGVDELSTREALEAIDMFARAGVTIIAFSGGEPLVRDDIFELVSHAAEQGIYVAMASNGTLITEEMAARMKNSGIRFLQISLDGVSAETHDAFRGVDGAFDRAVRGIKTAVANDFFVEISTTVTSHNYRELPDIIDYSEELGADWFMAYNFVPTGRGSDIADTDLSPSQREEMLHMLWRELKKDRDINVLSTAPQFARVALQMEGDTDEKTVPTHFYNPTLGGQLADLAEFIGGCGAGRFYMAMKANGDLQPCVFFPLTVGSIRTDSFEEIWKNSEVLHRLRDRDRMQACSNCEYRYYCGGCRARAYGYTGDYLAADPGCINNQAAYREVVEPLQDAPKQPISSRRCG